MCVRSVIPTLRRRLVYGILVSVSIQHLGEGNQEASAATRQYSSNKNLSWQTWLSVANFTLHPTKRSDIKYQSTKWFHDFFSHITPCTVATRIKKKLRKNCVSPAFMHLYILFITWELESAAQTSKASKSFSPCFQCFPHHLNSSLALHLLCLLSLFSLSSIPASLSQSSSLSSFPNPLLFPLSNLNPLQSE